MHLKFSLILLPLLLIPWSGLQAQSHSELAGIAISAQDMFHDTETKTIELSGQVQIVFKQQYLSCDKAVIDLKTKKVTAEGNIILQSEKSYSEGRKLEYNYETNLGVLYEGYVQSGQVVFEGQAIEKVGENDYISTDGSFTSCKNCPPSWSFTGSKIEAELGGYAYIKYPVFRIGGLPVFFLPAILVPLKSERQSGLLFPSYGINERAGSIFSTSYFWAISRNTDITITAKNYEKLGLKGLLEYRYVLDKKSKGVFKAAYLSDKKFVNKGVSKKINRHFFTYDYHYEMPYNIIHRMNLIGVSDLRYVTDYYDELPGNNDAALENRISITKNFNNHHLSTESAFYTNLLQTDATASNDDSVHRFPEIRYSSLEQSLFDTNLNLKVDLSYINFVRNNFGYDEVTINCETLHDKVIARCISDTRDGDYDTADAGSEARDLLRTGQRMIVSPTLSYSMQFAEAIDVVPTLSYVETQYRFNASPQIKSNNFDRHAARRFVEAGVSAKTVFSRIYNGDYTGVQSRKYKHKVIPQISFAVIPWLVQPNHTFFGDFSEQPTRTNTQPLSDSDFTGHQNKVQFDYKDRFFNKRLVTFSLTNDLIQKYWSGDQALYRTMMTFRLSQSYDLNQVDRESPLPWGTLNSLFKLKTEHFDTYATADYYPYANLTNTSLKLRVFDKVGDFAQIDYTKSVNVKPDGSVDDDSTPTENISPSLGWISRHFNLMAVLNYSLITHQTDSWGSTLTVKPPGECWEFTFNFYKPINGVLDTTFDFKFLF